MLRTISILPGLMFLANILSVEECFFISNSQFIVKLQFRNWDMKILFRLTPMRDIFLKIVLKHCKYFRIYVYLQNEGIVCLFNLCSCIRWNVRLKLRIWIMKIANVTGFLIPVIYLVKSIIYIFGKQKLKSNLL